MRTPRQWLYQQADRLTQLLTPTWKLLAAGIVAIKLWINFLKLLIH